MSDRVVTTEGASGEEIDRVVRLMLEGVANEPIPLIIMSSFALSLVLQNPDLTMEQLVEGIHLCSGFMAAYLEKANEGNLIIPASSIPN